MEEVLTSKKARRYKPVQCKHCGVMVDRSVNPRGALQKHYYDAHPEIKARIDTHFKEVRAVMLANRALRQEKGVVLEQEKTPQPKPVSAGNVVEDTMAELRAEEQEQEQAEQGGNGAGPDGNGHHELDLEDADNIYLRTAANPLLRSKAMIPKMERAASFGEAQIAAIVPKTMVINPMLIQIGMGITFNDPDFGWDPKMSPGQWIDEVLKWFFWYCGYEITPWRKLTPQELGITEGG